MHLCSMYLGLKGGSYILFSSFRAQAYLGLGFLHSRFRAQAHEVHGSFGLFFFLEPFFPHPTRGVVRLEVRTG